MFKHGCAHIEIVVKSNILSENVFYLSSTFLYLLEPVTYAIEPSCLAQMLSRSNIKINDCLNFSVQSSTGGFAQPPEPALRFQLS